MLLDDRKFKIAAPDQRLGRPEWSYEDRCGERYNILIPAKLRFTGQSAFTVEVVDLSMSGFGCEALTSMGAGVRCWLTLPGLGSLEAETVRNDGRILGCAFVNLLDERLLNGFQANYRAD